MKINTEVYQQVVGTVLCKCSGLVNHKKRNFFLFLSSNKMSNPSSSGIRSVTPNRHIGHIFSSGNHSFSAPGRRNCNYAPSSSQASWHR